MRAILDTNVLISAVIHKGGTPAQIIELWEEGVFDVIISPASIGELERVLHYPKIQKRLHTFSEDVVGFLELIRSEGVWVEPQVTLNVISADETDNRYLELAVEGQARYIVTGDNHLLQLHSYRGIEIVTPAVFLALLRTHDYTEVNLKPNVSP